MSETAQPSLRFQIDALLTQYTHPELDPDGPDAALAQYLHTCLEALDRLNATEYCQTVQADDLPDPIPPRDTLLSSLWR